MNLVWLVKELPEVDPGAPLLLYSQRTLEKESSLFMVLSLSLFIRQAFHSLPGGYMKRDREM